jgi:hypothetical protein
MLPVILAILTVSLIVILALFAPPNDISTFAWGYRIREFSLMNGKKEYRVQQRIPVYCIWVTCTYLIGYDMYTYRSYSTFEEAKEFLDAFKKSVEERKGYRVKSKKTLS